MTGSVLLLTAAGVFSLAGACVASAVAAGGPCGIASGTWTDEQGTCAIIKEGGRNLGGQYTYMTFGKNGKWAQWESLCQIRNPVLSGDICALQMACSVEGSTSVSKVRFRIVDSNSIAFESDSGAFDNTYMFCTPKPYSPYFDID
ncbi:hypothetical protein [Methyloceanibacter methanicus]|uniref:hypothetical protein n=1 Tax=Methyloceanibacter methanicus TaxID=1774968 RepID=UPI00114CBE11|nr:hypothetical protein [Methyloceanibacter methanicus]